MQHNDCSTLEADDLLENDCDEDISEEDKAFIFGIVSRIRRILNWNSISNEELYKRENGPQIIREILIQFQRWKQFLQQTYNYNTMGMQHLVIYNLAKLSFYYWIKDTRLISEILMEVYHCDGHFSSMFAHVINQYDRRSFWWRNGIKLKPKEDCASLFFIYHAHKARLEFNGVRFVDMRIRHPLSISPIFLAAIYNKPSLLKMLLRYGAIVSLRTVEMNQDWNLAMLLRHLLRIMWNSVGEEVTNGEIYDERSSIVSNTISNIAECLRMLLRAINQIPFGELDFLLMKFEHGVLTGSVPSHDFMRLLSEKGWVPKLINRYLEPSELSHLSRCSVRSALNTGWNLPYGIYSLPVPKTIMRYLFLEED